MQPKPSYIKALTVLHIALFGGQLMFTFIILVVLSIGKNYKPALATNSQLLLMVCIAVAALASFGGNAIYKKRLEALNQSADSASEKLEGYRGASIVRWAIMEFATLLSIILLFLTANYYILIVIAVLLFLFLSVRPTTSKVVQDLNVSESDLRVL